jgi:hypothetical protein
LSLENQFSAGLEQVWRDKPVFQPESDFCNTLYVNTQHINTSTDQHVNARRGGKDTRSFETAVFLPVC